MKFLDQETEQEYFKNIGIKPNMGKQNEINILQQKLRDIQYWVSIASLDARNNRGLKIAKKQFNTCSRRLYQLGVFIKCERCGRYENSFKGNLCCECTYLLENKKE